MKKEFTMQQFISYLLIKATYYFFIQSILFFQDISGIKNKRLTYWKLQLPYLWPRLIQHLRKAVSIVFPPPPLNCNSTRSIIVIIIRISRHSSDDDHHVDDDEYDGDDQEDNAGDEGPGGVALGLAALLQCHRHVAAVTRVARLDRLQDGKDTCKINSEWNSCRSSRLLLALLFNTVNGSIAFRMAKIPA